MTSLKSSVKFSFFIFIFYDKLEIIILFANIIFFEIVLVLISEISLVLFPKIYEMTKYMNNMTILDETWRSNWLDSLNKQVKLDWN